MMSDLDGIKRECDPHSLVPCPAGVWPLVCGPDTDDDDVDMTMVTPFGWLCLTILHIKQ